MITESQRQARVFSVAIARDAFRRAQAARQATPSEAHKQQPRVRYRATPAMLASIRDGLLREKARKAYAGYLTALARSKPEHTLFDDCACNSSHYAKHASYGRGTLIATVKLDADTVSERKVRITARPTMAHYQRIKYWLPNGGSYSL